jgi:hypothetical protein
MPPDSFARLTFRGTRFDRAAMPLEALPELAAYRDLVLAFARILYKKQNPDRQRLPKGFDESLKLVLERLEAGSTVAAVARKTSPPEGLFDAEGEHDYFGEARDLITEIIDKEGESELAPEFEDALGRFTAFGRTLSDDESIVVSTESRTGKTPYTRSVRKRILLRHQTTYEDEVLLVGEVRMADLDKEGFSLRIASGRRIDVQTLPLFFPLALRSLQGAATVRIRGTGLYDAQGVLIRVPMASDVSLDEEGNTASGNRFGCPASLDHQLEGLLSLPAGWYDGEGESYRSESIGWLKSLMDSLTTAFELPTPYVYPAVDGAVRFEWSTAGREVTLSITPSDRKGWALAMDARTTEHSELQMEFSQPGAESRLGRFLAEHLGGDGTGHVRTAG